MKYLETYAALWAVNIAFVAFIAFGWWERYAEVNTVQAALLAAVAIASVCLTSFMARPIAASLRAKAYITGAAGLAVAAVFMLVNSVGVEKAWDQLVEGPARAAHAAAETVQLSAAATAEAQARTRLEKQAPLAASLSDCVCPETRKGDEARWYAERDRLTAEVATAAAGTVIARNAVDARAGTFTPSVAPTVVQWVSRVVELAVMLGFITHAAAAGLASTGQGKAPAVAPMPATGHEAPADEPSPLDRWERLTAEREYRRQIEAREQAEAQTAKSERAAASYYRPELFKLRQRIAELTGEKFED